MSYFPVFGSWLSSVDFDTRGSLRVINLHLYRLEGLAGCLGWRYYTGREWEELNLNRQDGKAERGRICESTELA